MTKQEAGELLDLVAEHATKLRAVGVRRVSLGAEVYFELAPAEQPEAFGDEEEQPELDVLDDPSTYGRTRSVPGRNRKER